MKNSLKFLTAAGLLLLGSLTAYNAALHTEYQLGTFKDPLRNYTALPLTNFNAVDVPAAGQMNVKVEAGPFAVYVSKDAAKYVHVTQRGHRLTVALSYPEKETWLGRDEAVIIRCPRLSLLTAGTTYTVAGQRKTVPRSKFYQTPGGVVVKGFAQDSLRLVQNQTAQVELAGNRLGRLRAEVGGTPGSTAELDLNDDNRIDASDLHVEQSAKLVAKNLPLPALRWHFGDSARVELSGAALRGLR
ncbi:hypothetical protein [Hymenobacter terricola]|uniref:hypothetical protein n=1 Tax=Hymenobacter terricola TaxID=2819236 RepID=UPI001B30E7BC|nr:hypothetical protein [Hymenobacter terricola]